VNQRRRQFFKMAVCTVALPAIAHVGYAQAYPSRPVRMFVGFPPGGGTDIAARLIGQGLSDRLGQPVVIENRPGAGTTLATEIAARGAPDGYTLAFISGASGMVVYQKVGVLLDMTPVASVYRSPLVIVVNSSVPARTVSEFIAYAKANPGKINMGSAGTGTSTHLAGELFKMMAGINMIHVPYRGEAFMMADMFEDRVQVYFGTIGGLIEHIRAGKLRALAVTSATPNDMLPGTPSVNEFLPDFEVSSLAGICAPKGVPTAIVNKLNTEINAVLADPKVEARIVGLGNVVFASSPSDFGKHEANEAEKWGKLVKFANIKPE
jgi:tripartite-type tricarboxylate transporter receptor subunit TctC